MRHSHFFQIGIALSIFWAARPVEADDGSDAPPPPVISSTQPIVIIRSLVRSGSTQPTAEPPPTSQPAVTGPPSTKATSSPVAATQPGVTKPIAIPPAARAAATQPVAQSMPNRSEWPGALAGSSGLVDSRIKSLVEQLTSKDEGTHDDAEEQLLEIAQQAVQASARYSRDRMAKQRMLDMLDRLVIPPHPTRVTLHVKNVSGTAAIAALGEASGMPLFGLRPDSVTKLEQTKITVDADHIAYWSIVRQICQAARVELSYYDLPRGAFTIVSDEGGAWGSQDTWTGGPFAVHASKMTSGSEINLGNPVPSNNDMTLLLNLYVEPNLHAVACEQLSIDSCIDDKGHVLKARGGPFENSPAFPCELTYATVLMDSSNGTKLTKLDGTVTYLIGKDVRHIVLDHLVSPMSCDLPDAPAKGKLVQLEQENPAAWNARFSFDVSEMDDAAAASFRHGLEHSCPRLIDAQGRYWDLASPVRPHQEDNLIDLKLNYTRNDQLQWAPTAPDHLVWNLPVRTTHVEAHFHIADLPLP